MGLIGSAIGAAGSIFGGIKASKAMKKAKRNVEAQRQKNQDWYDRRYNEDATQRADAQRILTQTEESIKQRPESISGRPPLQSRPRLSRCNHLYFHTPSEPPLCKGDSRDVKNKK